MFRKSLLLLVFLLAYLVTNWLTGGEGAGLAMVEVLEGRVEAELLEHWCSKRCWFHVHSGLSVGMINNKSVEGE